MTAQVEGCELDVSDSELLGCCTLLDVIPVAVERITYLDVRLAGGSQLCRSVGIKLASAVWVECAESGVSQL